MNKEKRMARVDRAIAKAKEIEQRKKAKVEKLKARLREEAALARRMRAIDARGGTRVWKARHSEGARTFKALRSGDAIPLLLDDEEKDKIAELVVMICDENLCRQYPTWEARAAALDTTRTILARWRNTEEYHQAMQAGIKAVSLEGTAKALHTQVRIAIDKTHKQASKAFANLARLGGAESKAARNNTTVNLSIDASIKNLIKNAAITTGAQSARPFIPAVTVTPLPALPPPSGAGSQGAAGSKPAAGSDAGVRKKGPSRG